MPIDCRSRFLALNCLTPTRTAPGIATFATVALIAFVATEARLIARAPRVAFEVLHTFPSPTVATPAMPGSLVQASDGNLYGTTSYGGASGLGTIFQMTPDGTVTVVHEFVGGYEGANPTSLIQASDGNLYGTTQRGGLNNGMIFTLTLDGRFRALHAANYYVDGTFPANLVEGNDGLLYGTTSNGNSHNGTIFKMTRDGAVTVIHAFDKSETVKGAFPTALILAPDGTFYGVTSQGGSLHKGTAFAMTNSGSLTVLHDFGEPAMEGAHPSALVRGIDGAFYGVTAEAGLYGGGTVFKTTTSGDFKVLHAFDFNEGANATMVQSTDGSFFFTTRSGSTYGAGAVSMMTLGGNVGLLHAFDRRTDGASPTEAVIEAGDGTLWGTTADGGPAGGGTVFTVSRDGAFTVAHAFSGVIDGKDAMAAPIQGGDGSLYGTTAGGGAFGAGTVYRMERSGQWSILHSFSYNDGYYPLGLLEAADANVYGVTMTGGASSNGTVFRLRPEGGLSVLHRFRGGADGSGPMAGLIQAADGNLYGTTSGGGRFEVGTIFRMTTAGAMTVVYEFTGKADGAWPEAAGVIQASDGALYGTTISSGAHDFGTIFRLTTEGSFAVLHAFNAEADGYVPMGSLVEAGDGRLYGMTAFGGPFDAGTVFQITSDGTFSVLHTFTGGEDGGNPTGGLIVGNDGRLYGAANGRIFRMTSNGEFTVLHAIDAKLGYPVGPLMQGRDGNFYGTTRSGTGRGVLFRLRVFPDVERVPLDVRPGSCANPLNPKSKGVLPVAVLGTGALDVSRIDPATLRLNGVAPLRWAGQDVGTAADNGDGAVGADCAAGSDGHADLTLKFATPLIAATLASAASGEMYTLKLTGNLKAEYGGTPIEGEDFLVIVGSGPASSKSHETGADQIPQRGRR